MQIYQAMCILKRLLQIGLVSLCFSSIAIACDEKCATQVGNREVQRLGLDLSQLEIKIDDENKRWERFMAYTKKGPDKETKMLYEKYNAKLQGKTFWVVYFSLKPIKGTYPKGGGATVLIDRQTSEPLLVIRGE
jgi:hypothetical protein